jgi:tripartite-type tricarboxylate transporter receptor subunit TctC
MRHYQGLLATTLVSGLALAAGSKLAMAETAAEFYKGKTITSISGFGEDAVITIFSRIAAPYISKFTGARVIVKPMSGGGGTLARNHMFQAKPDGLTICLTGHGPKILTSGLFELQGVRYDWSKFTFLGKTIATNTAVIVSKKSPWTKPSDIGAAKFNYGESSPFFGPLFAEAYGWKNMTIIPGYRSTTGRAVAISRGELQAGTASAQTIVANPDLVMPLVFAFPDKGFPGTASLAGGVASGGKKWADYIEGWDDVQFLSYAPPGIPADRAKFLESALEKMWADPKYRADLKKIKQNPAPEFVTSKKLSTFIASLSKLSADDIKEMRFVITKKYKKK